MSSITRKIDDAISEYGSMEAYLATIGNAEAPLIPMFGDTLSPLPRNIFEPQLSNTMDYKIIKVDDLQTDLLIRRDFTDQGEPCVILEFYAMDSDDSEYQHVELVEFESAHTAKKYVRDFSPASAKEFIESNLREPSN